MNENKVKLISKALASLEAIGKDMQRIADKLKAEREEMELSRVTLDNQEKACLSAAGLSTSPVNLRHAAAAAETIRKIEEDGRKLKRWCFLLSGGSSVDAYYAKDVESFLSSLGVEKRP